jgi:glucose-6-phosphate 1-epimerase
VTEEFKELKITGATDRVYESAPNETRVAQGTSTLFSLQRDNFKDVVVWNPYVEGAASMGDFEPKDGWKHMVLAS